MPSNYKRTTTRKSWSQEDMVKAIEAVKENSMGWLLASKRFNVPQATLRRHYYSTPENLGRFKPTFNADMEKVLVDHVLDFERRLFGFNTTEIRKLAFEFAEKMKLDHRFDKSKKIAGWDWLKGFRERNLGISLRAPEATSAARARAFNKPQVMNFFSLLEKAVTDNEIQAHRIYNMDESGLNTVQKPPKVFASKGKKQVGAVTSAERGEHFTVVACANAIGNFVPPAIIIPRKNHKAEYFDGAPPGTLQLCYPSGYMVSDLFCKWMRHFASFVNASVTNKVLLILDGHSSHKNLEALEFAKANGVIMLCLPPHCTHRMQPTDISFFGPLQAYYDREMATWMKNHPGRTINLYQVAQIFGRAYENAASVRNITSGFAKSGIYPFNPHIFPEDMYLPSDVTENELNNDDGPVASSSSLPQQNHEESDSSESTDVGQQTEVAAANSHDQINFETGASGTAREFEQPSDVTENELNSDDGLVASISSLPQQNHEESDSSESTDVGQQTDVVTANSHEQINLEIGGTSQELESYHSSSTILSAGVGRHFSQDHDANISSQSQEMLLESGSMQPTNANQQMDATIAPQKDATFRVVDSRPSSLKLLTANAVAHLLQDHDANISSRSRPMLLESDSKQSTNGNEYMDVTIAPEEDATILSASVVGLLSLDHGANILSRSRPIFLESSSKQPTNANEETDVTNAPKIHYQVQIEDAILSNTKLLKEISPLPKAASTGKLRATRKVGGSQILTASPYMCEVKAAVQLKKEKENRKSLRKQKHTKRVIFEDDVEPEPAPKKCRSTRGRKQSKRVILDDDKDLKEDDVEPESASAPRKCRSTRGRKQSKRVILDDDKDLKEDDVEPESTSAPRKYRSTRGRKQTKRGSLDGDEDLGEDDVEPESASTTRKYKYTRGRKQTKRGSLDDDEDLEEVKDPYANEDEEADDPACIYCNELFSQSRPKEHWVKCQLCSNWCHTQCAGISARKKQFTCELCLGN